MIFKAKNKNIEYGTRPLIMGIANVTPDSFSDGGKYFDTKNAINHIYKMAKDGADIIDIGGQSTRPNHTLVDEKEEYNRLKDVIVEVRKNIDLPISVDTFYPYVAQRVAELGADIINDVSGKLNDDMAQIIKDTKCGWIIMHSGSGSVKEVKDFFIEATNYCNNFGIDKSQICLDMGIGFGKDYNQNLELIANISDYKLNDYPLLLGLSKKRVIGTASNQTDPQKRVYGNIAAHTVGILGGADIIRLHDVEQERQGILTATALKEKYGRNYN